MRIVVFTGAGVSAESGIKTFRDENGLWEGHDVMEVASPQGFHNDPELVLDFYNQRRAQLNEVDPNPAHIAIARLESHYDVTVVTQNVDDLHERAGSSDVVHLHGELKKARSSGNEEFLIEIEGDIKLGEVCPQGFQLRPHVVWFGEAVPMMQRAAEIVSSAELLLVVGTSLQVYPAAGLIDYAPGDCRCIYVDPRPQISFELQRRPHEVIAENAGTGVPQIVEELLP
ncbi:MAG: NAD-dependent deacylase [Saprospiraceae bacterium]|nr:NAD-dependent deacylase [Saprospiraceae bacterium]